jgi:hypothetical protein
MGGLGPCSSALEKAVAQRFRSLVASEHREPHQAPSPRLPGTQFTPPSEGLDAAGSQHYDVTIASRSFHTVLGGVMYRESTAGTHIEIQEVAFHRDDPRAVLPQNLDI